MRKGILCTVVLTSAVALLAANHAAATARKVTHLGNSRTTFCKPGLKGEKDVRLMVQKKKADMQTILQITGWTGDVEDIARAAQDPATTITKTTIDPGANIPYMAMRRHGKPQILEDVIWAGKKSIDVYVMEFISGKHKYRLYVPAQCGNFWIEQLPGDATTISTLPVTVSVSAIAEACVTQSVPVTVNVTNAASDAQVSVTADGQQPATGVATGGVFQTTLPGYREPGRHEIKATVGDVSNSSVVTINPCPPTCSLSVAPPTLLRGKPILVDGSGSKVAPNVTVGLKSVTVDVDRNGAKFETFDLLPPSLRRDDYRLGKPGAYTFKATAIDEVGQKSTNACEAAVEVKRPPLLFGGVFFGKERLDREEFNGGHCAPLFGAKIGILSEIAENVQLEASVGVKVDVDDTGNSSAFLDFALNYLLSKGFIGGGVSAWNITDSDTRAAALLLQGGMDVTKDGCFQFVVEGRLPFNQMDNIANNYQFWGGVRIRGAYR